MGQKYQDIQGRQFDHLTILKYDHSYDRHTYWLCKCDCGNEKVIRRQSFVSGNTKSCGCRTYTNRSHKIHDLTDRRFGRWLVKRCVGTKHNLGSVWLCECDCGVQKEVGHQPLIKGRSKSCGCSKRLSKGKAALNQILGSYKHGAEKRNLVWELSDDEFKKITSSECYYCGALPKQSVMAARKHMNGDYLHNGIDRVDNNEGYTSGNCVPCCSDCNYFKSTLSSVDFLSRIERIYKHINGI